MAETVTKTFKFTAPAGTENYTSSAITDKTTELLASGDLVSISETVLSGTEKTVTMVWKDDAARASFASWMGASGEGVNATAYNSLNSISITEL